MPMKLLKSCRLLKPMLSSGYDELPTKTEPVKARVDHYPEFKVLL